MALGARVRDESGQAMTEYILMVAFVVGLYWFVAKAIGSAGWGDKIMAPFTKQFAAVYQYGHPKAKFDPGGGGQTQYHPRAIESGEGNFRIFMNPVTQ